MSNNKKFYITTPIYYPSGKFHIGTAYTTTLANTIKKYRELRGYDAYLLTGLDEHGQKIQDVALSRGKKPQEHVDEMAEAAIELWKKMKINYDDFIRTTEERHEKVVEKIFTKFKFANIRTSINNLISRIVNKIKTSMKDNTKKNLYG